MINPFTSPLASPAEPDVPVFDQDGGVSFWKSLIQSSADAIVSYSVTGLITSWNPAAERLLGYQAFEIIGKNISVIIPSKNAWWLSSMIDFFARGQQPAVHHSSAVAKDGIMHTVSVNTSPIYGNKGILAGFSGILRETAIGNDAEEKLSEVESTLQIIFEHAEEAFILVDRDLVVKSFNPKAAGSITVSFGDTPLSTGESLYRFIDPNREEALRESARRVLMGESVHYELQYRERDGQPVWFSFNFNPVREATEVTGMCITASNITTQRKAQEAVVLNENRFRGMVENSFDAVLIFDKDSRPLYVSPSTYAMLGYNESDSADLSLFDVIHPDDLPGVKQMWNKVLANPRKPFPRNICRIRHKNGGYRWIDGTLTNFIDDPSIQGIVDNFRDVTESIQAAQKLKESEEQYRFLFNNNPFPMWIYEEDSFRFLEVNNAALSKYGYTKQEFLALSIADVIPYKDLDSVKEAVKERRNQEYNYGGTWEHMTKDGKRLHVEISSHQVTYQGRNAVLVLANDVTNKKIAEQLLLKAYDENISILESITDGFYTIDDNWLVTYWNHAAETMMGAKREDIVGRNLWDLFRNHVSEECYQQYLEAARTRQSLRLQEYIAPRNMWVEVSVFPGEKGLSVYFRDITEARMAQEVVFKAKERFELIAAITNDAVYDWNIETNIEYWGEGYETLFGHTLGPDRTGENIWKSNIHPDEQHLREVTQEAIRNKQTSLTREMRFRCADGNYKTVFDRLRILYNEKGQAVRIVGAMQDITERKTHELAIGQLNSQLAKRAADLARSNEELERFAYVASHDLQEPLRMVSSFLQLLEKKYSERLDETAIRYIDFAVDGAERMKRLILDLLEYSRVGTNKDLKVKVNLNEVMSEVQKNLSVKLVEKNAALITEELPSVMANKMQIVQLFQNLVGNAVKYNLSEKPTISIAYTERPGAWEFSVTDNGIGIDEKFAHKVFVIFQRLHNKDQFSGTGIGLAICKKIVERHNGEIWIRSKPGEGSTFFFTMEK